MQEPRSPDEGRGGHGPHPEHDGHEAATTDDTLPTPHDLMGHGGHGAMSMEDMVADMRRRFLVAALFSVPILLWSPIGRRSEEPTSELQSLMRISNAVFCLNKNNTNY